MDENKSEEYVYHNGIAYISDQDKKNIDKETKRKEKEENYWFTGLQTVVCLLILLGVLMLKGIGGEWYVKVKDWYRENIDQSVLIEYDPAEIKQEIFELFDKEEKTS